MTKNTINKNENLHNALADKYNEGSVITLQDIYAVYREKMKKKNKSKKIHATKDLPHPVAIRKNPDYKIGRNQYIVTTSKEPAKVKEAIMNALEIAQDKKSA